MVTAAQEVQALAIEAAAQRLKRAATFAASHIDKPLFKKTMRVGTGPAVLVRLDWPGVLRVFEIATGEMLAESLPGQPDRASARFSQLTSSSGDR